MSVNVPLHKWRSADPAILIGRRCIARTDDDVVIDGRLELIRWPDGTATLRFQGIGTTSSPRSEHMFQQHERRHTKSRRLRKGITNGTTGPHT